MIIKSLDHQAIEHYEQYLTLKNQKTYCLYWKAKVLQFYTCGHHNNLVECLEYIPNSLFFRELFPNGGLGSTITLDEFNSCYADEPLNFKSNCHGFTFSHGKYLINNYFVDIILNNEYEEVVDKHQIHEGNFDVLCLKCNDTNEWIHSCKYQYDLFIHKEGLRQFSIHLRKEEIIQIPEYQNTTLYYFKRKQRTCRGICIHPIGEEFVPLFGNEMP